MQIYIAYCTKMFVANKLLLYIMRIHIVVAENLLYEAQRHKITLAGLPPARSEHDS
jgi:hypothetical protein